MKTTDIIRDVALLLGVNPGEADGGLSPFPSLGDRILADLEEAAASAILTTPRDRLTGWCRFTAEGTFSDNGDTVITLPEDFLMLHSISLPDWEIPVTEIRPHSHWLRTLQHSQYRGLRASPSRPLAFMEIDANGKNALRLYPGDRENRFAEGWYMPAPKINAADEIGIPSAAYKECLRRIAGYITGNFTGSG